MIEAVNFLNYVIQICNTSVNMGNGALPIELAGREYSSRT
jgi:hypothetical protein